MITSNKLENSITQVKPAALLATKPWPILPSLTAIHNAIFRSHHYEEEQVCNKLTAAAKSAAAAAARQGQNEINTAMTLNRLNTCEVVVF